MAILYNVIRYYVILYNVIRYIVIVYNVIRYVELSFGFRARDDSSLAFAIMMFNKGCIYIKLYFFTKFDKQLVYRLTEITNNK